jgi:preprotein translocase SecF subunit
MPWPLIKLVPLESNIKFVRFAFFASFVSIFAVVASFASMFTGGFRENPIEIYQKAEGSPGDRLGLILSHGFNLGIDFQGGTLVEVQAPNPIDLGPLRSSLNALDIGDVQVQAFGDPTHALVRFHPTEMGAETALQKVEQDLRTTIANVRIVRTEVVGPKVSGELFASGLIALGLAMLLVMVYIWVRFGLTYGWGAVLSLFHDTILTLGVFSVFRLDFTLPVIAGLLTVIGYSMNDTVVVFDRMRENFRKYRKRRPSEVIDLSINETLSRTTVTAATALLASIALYFYGGETLRSFAICMIFGIVVATYSSIYIAAPALPLFEENPTAPGSASGKPAPKADEGAT